MSVVNYKKSYFQVSKRHIGCEEEKEKPALSVRMRRNNNAYQTRVRIRCNVERRRRRLYSKDVGNLLLQKFETKMYIA